MKTFGSHRGSPFFVLAVLILSACGGPPASPPEDNDAPIKVRLALNWFPEAEHGGFYAALEHGYYSEAGLDVEILPGGPGASVIPRVATGQVEFGVTNADDLLFGLAEGADVTALLAPIETSPRCIIVHESSGIRKLADLKDVTLAVSANKAFARFMELKLDLTGVTIVPYPGNVAQFLSDSNYAQQGYVFSEPFVAKEQGGDPRVLLLAEELGFNPYTSILVTSGKLVAERRDIAKRMAEASRRGWRHYLRAPEETNRRINSLNSEMGLPILAYGAEKLRELAGDDSDSFGAMTGSRWEELHSQMVEAELLTKAMFDPMSAYVRDL